MRSFVVSFVTVANELQKTKGKKDKRRGKNRTLPARKQSRPLNRSYRNKSRSEKKIKPANTTEVLGQTYESNINHKF